MARTACFTGTILLLVLLRPAAGQEAPSTSRVSVILQTMGVQKGNFDPAGLHAMGLAGLSAVLDRLLPDTAKPDDAALSEDDAAELIERLGHRDFTEREAATAELIELGVAARPYLLEAARHTDAEISWRARRILRKWQSVRTEPKAQYVPAFEVYLKGIEDEPRIEELARRAWTVLEVGVPSAGRKQIVSLVMTTVARSGNDRLINLWKPLLEHEQVKVAVLVLQTAAAGSRNGRCPELLLAALRSDRQEVLAEAVTWSSSCAEGPFREQVRRRLIELFEGDDDALRFRACHALIRAFGFDGARDYLLEQAESHLPQRQARALAWLGEFGNFEMPADAKLLAVVKRLLESPNAVIRRRAARALAMYSGENVVVTLIPLLDDPNAALAGEIKYRLRHQSDKKMLRRVLAAAAEDDANERVRTGAAAIAAELEKEEKKP